VWVVPQGWALLSGCPLSPADKGPFPPAANFRFPPFVKAAAYGTWLPFVACVAIGRFEPTLPIFYYAPNGSFAGVP